MEAINELRKVYEVLSDEESREIFRLRMEYLLTGDYRSIEAITRKYLPTLSTSPYYTPDEIVKMAGEKDIVIYAAGGDLVFYKDYWDGFPKGRIVAFCDKNENMQKLGFLGNRVISPRQLSDEYNKNSFVVISSTIYGDDIKNELLQSGFSSDQILNRIFLALTVFGDQYFDREIIKFDEGEQEVFVDGGSLDLSSVLQLESLTTVKKAYAFEPNHDHFQRCGEIKKHLECDIELFPYGLWSKKR